MWAPAFICAHILCLLSCAMDELLVGAPQANLSDGALNPIPSCFPKKTASALSSHHLSFLCVISH